MQDYLTDRPVLTVEGVRIIVPSSHPGSSRGDGLLARVVRSEPMSPASRASVSRVPASAAPAHTSQVKPVMENGRVSRLIVTCSCGKVTEIACTY